MAAEQPERQEFEQQEGPERATHHHSASEFVVKSQGVVAGDQTAQDNTGSEYYQGVETSHVDASDRATAATLEEVGCHRLERGQQGDLLVARRALHRLNL
ncbi:MAG: hypothetical protein VX951_02805 [Planctomycetota bacterium]|nr:hypothetical protein [Planctomycetota bacterium]